VRRRQEDDLDVVELYDAPTAAAPAQVSIRETAFRTRRIPRRRLAAAVAALILAAALVGFAIGRSGRPAPAGTGRTTSLPVVSIAPNGVIGGTGRRCALRMGRQMQLGVEVENLGPATVQLVRLDVIVPSAELREISVGVGACAQLGPGEPVVGSTIGTLGTLWLSTVLTATVACPAASAVQFRLTYMQAGQRPSTKIFAFADLGQVPYDSCRPAQ
jgi:hypothetical protein